MEENSVDPTRKTVPPDPEEEESSKTELTLQSTTNTNSTEFRLDQIASEESSTSSDDDEEHVLEDGFHQRDDFKDLYMKCQRQLLDLESEYRDHTGKLNM